MRGFLNSTTLFSLAIAALASVLLPACDSGRDLVSPTSTSSPTSSTSNVTPDFTSGPACALWGVVREGLDSALSVGAVVRLVKEPGGFSAPVIQSTTTDASGTYRIEGIDCGISRIAQVNKPDFFSHEESVLILGDTQRDFTIGRVTYRLAGIIRESPSGMPLVGATVEAVSGPYAGQRSTTYTDGSYFLSVRDTLTVRASKPGYISQEGSVTVTYPAADRDFSLTKQPLGR